MSVRASMSLSVIYRWPVAVALVIAAGLASALAGDGIARILSWIALAFPIGLIVVCLWPAVLKRRTRAEGRAATTTTKLNAFQQ
jgi:hypothetical protein